MTRVLALDISTSSGFAVLDKSQDGVITLHDYGAIQLEKPVVELLPEEGYPWAYLTATWRMARQLVELTIAHQPTDVVIEHPNLGRNRLSQRILEWIHFSYCYMHRDVAPATPIYYIDSSAWRMALKLTLTKADKAQNSRLSRAKRQSKTLGKKLDKKKLGIAGKITQKHVAIRYVNARWGLDLGATSDDAADAICQAEAFLVGAPLCTGRNERSVKQESTK